LAELIQLLLLKILIRYLVPYQQLASNSTLNSLILQFLDIIFGDSYAWKLQEVTSLQFDENQGYLIAVGSSIGKVWFILCYVFVWFSLLIYRTLQLYIIPSAITMSELTSRDATVLQCIVNLTLFPAVQWFM
jgi:hypothetical protein